MFARNAGRSVKRKLLNQNTMFLKALKNVRNQVNISSNRPRNSVSRSDYITYGNVAIRPAADRIPYLAFLSLYSLCCKLNVLVYQYFTEGIELFFQD